MLLSVKISRHSAFFQPRISLNAFFLLINGIMLITIGISEQEIIDFVTFQNANNYWHFNIYELKNIHAQLSLAYFL